MERLQGRWENIQVEGYTNRVWEYMSRADLIVSKPGGITLFETIFAQVPIFTWPPTLQQERGNASWLVQEGIGWVADRQDCAGEIREILMDRQRLTGAAARMRRIKERLELESLDRLMAEIARTEEVAVWKEKLAGAAYDGGIDVCYRDCFVQGTAREPSLGMLEAFEPLVFVAGACFDVWICRL